MYDQPGDSAQKWRPVVVAHRGAWHRDLPENSKRAFERAAEQGFPSECDIQQSIDGEPIVIHDETLDRTTTGRGRVADCAVEALEQLKLKYAGGLLNEPPPLLRDVWKLVSLVEIKPPNAQALVSDVVRMMEGRRDWLLQSFDPANVQHALDANPATAIALLVDRFEDVEPALRNRWNVNVDHQLLNDRTSGILQDHGVRVGVWTVNTEAEILRVLPYRPDVIISDQPVLVRSIIERSGLQIGTLP